MVSTLLLSRIRAGCWRSAAVRTDVPWTN